MIMPGSISYTVKTAILLPPNLPEIRAEQKGVVFQKSEIDDIKRYIA